VRHEQVQQAAAAQAEQFPGSRDADRENTRTRVPEADWADAALRAMIAATVCPA
jgi:hypothetical protein